MKILLIETQSLQRQRFFRESSYVTQSTIKNNITSNSFEFVYEFYKVLISTETKMFPLYDYNIQRKIKSSIYLRNDKEQTRIVLLFLENRFPNMSPVLLLNYSVISSLTNDHSTYVYHTRIVKQTVTRSKGLSIYSLTEVFETPLFLYYYRYLTKIREVYLFM